MPQSTSRHTVRAVRLWWICIVLIIAAFAPFASATLSAAATNTPTPSPQAASPPITVANIAQLRQTMRFGNGTVAYVTWSPDGTILAVAGALGIWLYQANALNSPPRLLPGPFGAINDMAFSPDGALIVAGTKGGYVKVWNVASGQVAAIMAGHTDVVTGVAFSPDGKLIASSSYDGFVRLWDASRFQSIAILNGNTDPDKFQLVVSVEFSPDGK